MNHGDYFKDKKITVMGLGLLGRGIGDTAYLARSGAELIVTDIKSEEELAPALAELREYSNITYVLGEHRLEDFQNRDMVLKAAGVPFDSIYIQEAENNKIPVEMSASLVAKLTGATVVGVTGTRGKSTVTNLIHHVLQKQGKKIHLGGNVRGIATLPLLEVVHKDDIIVMELDSWQMQGFGSSKISPQVGVFTTFYPDHMNYYRDDMRAYFNDKANIFKYQNTGDLLVVSPQASGAIEKYFTGPINSEEVVVDALPIHNRSLSGAHNNYNAACAMEVAKHLGMKEEEILSAINDFPGVEGRLQFVRTVGGVDVYNDNNATTGDATIVGLQALSHNKNVILIMGGSDKGLNMGSLISEIPKHCKSVVMFSGTGTEGIKESVFGLYGDDAVEKELLDDCVKEAVSRASEGDVILYSPAFASFGKYFKNEYDRNDQFMEIVKKL